ncbi:MAG: c-type cytochrome [Acidobacteria bacterium]|nr:c-type cytochrome [Acidobacteriota bacterium]MBM3764325.1 c-type cytochrome [Acidobacteriota bacterium]
MRIQSILLVIAAVAGLVSCGPGAGKDTPPIWVFPDMKIQEKYKPQQESPLFSDRRASRKPVEGTVSREGYVEDEGYSLGIVSGQYVGKNPLELNQAVLAHGQKKFNTYCAPCHDRTASGGGIVGKRAGAAFQPADLHKPETKQKNDGELYSIASDGRRTMMGYRNQISNYDRWAVVAYLRALQRAKGATIDDVPENLRGEVR